MLIRVLLVVLVWPSVGQAAVYFDETFETTLAGNGWSTQSCQFLGYTDPYPANGCNPFITSEIAHGGSKALRADYTGNPPSRAGCSNSPTIECGVTVYRTFPSTGDLWNRFWYRTAPGWSYGSISTKNIYLYTTDNTPSFVWGHHFNGSELQLDAQGIPTQVCPSGNTGNTCSFWPNLATVPLNNDQWYCIETRLNVGSAGGADALFEAWINGTQTIGYYGKRFLEAGQPDALNQVKIYAQSGSGVMYYDDFALGSTRMGCGGVAPPTPDTTPPSPPTNLAVN